MQSIGILAPCDVVAKPEPAGTKPELAFACGNFFQLFDWVLVGFVVRVHREDSDCFFKSFYEVRMLGRQFFSNRSKWAVVRTEYKDKKQILRLTTPKLESVWGPVRSG
jgi:hypothetical protein